MADDRNYLNAIGILILFSFVSVMVFFISLTLLAAHNNYVLQDLYNLIQSLVNQSIMNAQTGAIADTFNGLVYFISYMDKLWLISFITFSINAVIYSYFSKRSNYFSLLSIAVFGLIIIMYLGGIIIQFTDWFKLNVLYAVFPTLSTQVPFFAWYLDNIGIINLIMIVLCIIANFLNIDFSSFNKTKNGGKLEEI